MTHAAMITDLGVLATLNTAGELLSGGFGQVSLVDAVMGLRRPGSFPVWRLSLTVMV